MFCIVLLVAASGAATLRCRARSRFHCAHEGAQKFAVDLRSDRVDVDAGLREELAGVVDMVDARGFDFDVTESG